MDLSRLLSMIGRMVFRKAMNKGIRMGVETLATRGKPAAEMTPEDRAQAARTREMAKRARQAAKITRRLGR
jgi:hypothetical protein